MEKTLLAKLTDEPNYLRDMETGAVVLNNRAQLDKYYEAREKRIKELEKMSALQREVDALRLDVLNLSAAVKQLQQHNN